jgi:hypothetical protein
MKKLSKYLVKLLFVIILPIVSIIISTLLIMKGELSKLTISAIIIMLVISTVNALFFSEYMYNVKLIPKFKFDLMAVFGFAIGRDVNSKLLVILLPFCTIEVDWRK